MSESAFVAACRDGLGVAFGRLAQMALRVMRKKGSGGPGLVTNRISPGLLERVLASFSGGLVVVSGTSGKSTTTKMVTALLRAHGLRVFTNSSTANLPQGIASAVLEAGNWRGRVRADIAVIEMDEAYAAKIADQYSARVLTLTNINLDDIERFQSAERVISMLTTAAHRATDALVINADDASLARVAEAASGRNAQLKVQRFGMSQQVIDAQPHGLGYVRTASTRLPQGEGTLVQQLHSRDAVIDQGAGEFAVTLPARGAHFAIDAAAAFETARAVLGDAYDQSVAAAAMNAVEPVFGRGETVEIAGQQIECILVQNTGSFQLNVDALGGERERLYVGVCDAEDDPSWLWTVHTGALGHVDVVAGPKADAMANRFFYDGVTVDRVEDDLIRAFDDFLELPPPSSGVKTVIFTSRAMRKIRGHYGLTREEVRQGGSLQ
jgi:UDP-N-acetylmuramyl tripeptide synthase